MFGMECARGSYSLWHFLLNSLAQTMQFNGKSSVRRLTDKVDCQRVERQKVESQKVERQGVFRKLIFEKLIPEKFSAKA